MTPWCPEDMERTKPRRAGDIFGGLVDFLSWLVHGARVAAEQSAAEVPRGFPRAWGDGTSSEGD
jgi:hypothetical protein